MIPETADDLRKMLKGREQNLNWIDPSFRTTKAIYNFIEFDEMSQRVFIPTLRLFFSYSDIIDFEILEDGETVTRGGLGSAIVGGVLFGGAGAIVGGVTAARRSNTVCRSLFVKITVKNMNPSALYIDFLRSFTGYTKSSPPYNFAFGAAQECISSLQVICDAQKTTVAQLQSGIPSQADEILKFKDLLDKGIITESEFETKKKQILGQ